MILQTLCVVLGTNALGVLCPYPPPQPGAGMVGGPLVGALATEHWGPGAPFYCVGVAGAVGALLYALWLPETKAKARLGPPGHPGQRWACASSHARPGFKPPDYVTLSFLVAAACLLRSGRVLL